MIIKLFCTSQPHFLGYRVRQIYILPLQASIENILTFLGCAEQKKANEPLDSDVIHGRPLRRLLTLITFITTSSFEERVDVGGLTSVGGGGRGGSGSERRVIYFNL